MRNPIVRRWSPLAAALLFLTACGEGRSEPARPDPLEALSADSAAILDDLRVLSSDSLEGRAAGSDGARRARDYLLRRLADAGIEPAPGGFQHAFAWAPREGGDERRGVNLVGVTGGTERAESYIVVSAHYDHVGVRDGEVFNGADDNASGAAALVALGSALRDHPLRHSVLWVAFDAEEVGLRGSRAFVEDPPVPLDAVVVNLNLDMVARTDGLLWAAGAHHTPSLSRALEEAAARAPLDLRMGHDRPDAPEGDDWTRASDHGAFHAAGIPFVYLGVDDHADYHRPTDDFERVDPGEYMNAIRAALLTLLALDRHAPFPPQETR